MSEQIQRDLAKARRMQMIEGEWLLKEDGGQFRSTINFEGGEALFEADNPAFMGGGGTVPGPRHYCFHGLSSGYTGVFATMAAMQGIALKKLTARAETDINFSRSLGLAINRSWKT